MRVPCYAPHAGWIEIICGSMFSGKTEELLRRLRRAQIAKQRVQVFKPSVDDRYSADHVQSHDSNRLLSYVVRKSQDILDHVDASIQVVGIDEVQFLDPMIVEVVEKLAHQGVRVIAAGLDMDFRGVPFGSMPHLLAIAEEITKLSAVCMQCGNPASRTQRKLENISEAQILIGANEFYEARCRACFQVES